MNKLQKVMGLLWVLATILCIGFAVSGGLGAVAFWWVSASVIFLGMVWVFADKPRSKRTFALALCAGLFAGQPVASQHHVL